VALRHTQSGEPRKTSASLMKRNIPCSSHDLAAQIEQIGPAYESGKNFREIAIPPLDQWDDSSGGGQRYYFFTRGGGPVTASRAHPPHPRQRAVHEPVDEPHSRWTRSIPASSGRAAAPTQFWLSSAKTDQWTTRKSPSAGRY
jgi:hypothetical protein